MVLTETITVGDKEVSVKELTTAEIRVLMKKAESEYSKSKKNGGELFDVGSVIFTDITYEDITEMSSLSMSDLDKLGPSEIRRVAELCKSVNSHFFSMIERLNKALKEQMDKLALKEQKGSIIPKL